MCHLAIGGRRAGAKVCSRSNCQIADLSGRDAIARASQRGAGIQFTAPVPAVLQVR